jgi:hypothetical protein
LNPDAADTAPAPATRRKRKRAKKPPSKSASAKSPGKPAKKSARPYPARTLEEALKIPQAIREKNNGNPWATEDVAQAALAVKKTNNKFFYLAAAARDYGLTVGTRDTDKIELAPLGREIVFAPDEPTRQKKQLEAFFSIDIFKRVYEHYGSAKLPEKEFLSNVLQNDFGLDPEFHDEFAAIFVANCKFLRIDEGLTDDQRKTQKAERPEHTPEVRVIGEPKGKFDRTAFVVMPFVEKGRDPRPAGFFSEVLRSLITPAGNNAGFAVETAAQDGSDVIQSTIINQLLTADLVVADLTDHNPNVLFELGIRIAKELPVALIKAEGTGPIFDVDNMMRVASYSPNLWASSIATDLPRLRDHIKAAWDNRGTVRSYMQILTRVAA